MLMSFFACLAPQLPKTSLPWVKKLTKDVGDATLAWATAVTSGKRREGRGLNVLGT
jgi:hypothetical protein